ncbi:rRNA methyltransferase 1, mitochondrial [Bagarius yarrelli]|uniref:rRNA methyltransferase 1, mitochondrial n=1 Tax=Bagarius yarrelli TaxID=175774 RepID=A0A556TYN2_BAGYA|nr:rRNA methyltransferase 1, mitochondrial [Bagarius yarrelli]
MWRTACRSLRVITNNTHLEISTFHFTDCTQHALYHNSKTCFCPEDTGFKTSQRVRRNPFKSSVDLSRIIRPSAKPPGPGRGSGPKHKVSTKLQKPNFKDVSEPEPRKLSKKDKDKITNSHLQKENQHELVFGVAPCLLALTQEKRRLVQLYVQHREGRQRESVVKVCDSAVRRGVPVRHITKREMVKMMGGVVHQGLCLQASRLGFLTKDKSSSEQGNGRHGNPYPLWLILDGVQDPMNLGSVLRTAYFLGVDRVASSIRNSCPLTPVVSKASSGVMEIMNVYGYENLADFIKVKRKHGWQAVGSIAPEETSSGVSVISSSEFKMSRPTLLLMGGEGLGLSPELRELCDVFLTIPPRRELHPAVDSLNVSVATVVHPLEKRGTSSLPYPSILNGLRQQGSVMAPSGYIPLFNPPTAHYPTTISQSAKWDRRDRMAGKKKDFHKKSHFHLESDLIPLYVVELDLIQLYVVKSDLIHLYVVESDLIQLYVVESDLIHLYVVESDLIQLYVVESDLIRLCVVESDLIQLCVVESDLIQLYAVELHLIYLYVVESDLIQLYVVESDLIKLCVATPSNSKNIQTTPVRHLTNQTESHPIKQPASHFIEQPASNQLAMTQLPIPMASQVATTPTAQPVIPKTSQHPVLSRNSWLTAQVLTTPQIQSPHGRTRRPGSTRFLAINKTERLVWSLLIGNTSLHYAH